MNLIFDIGFNIGEFTFEAFKKYKNVSVVAVEANPSLYMAASNKFSTDFNFTLLNNVVSDKDDELVDFYISSYATGVSTASTYFMENSRFTKGSKHVEANSIKWQEPIKLSSITIDSMVERFGIPDLLKIDVEGYELNVLKGLTQKINDICFEWHEEEAENLYKILDHLENLGYEEFGVIGYFDEGDVFPKATFSDKGDPYLQYPENFFKRNELELEKLLNPERRVNYGMFFVK